MALRELLAHFKIKIDGAGSLEASLQKLNANEGAAKKLATAWAALKTAIPVAALGLGAMKLRSWVEAQTAAVDEIGKLATALSVSTDALQEWNAFAVTSGGSSADVAASLRRLSKGMSDAARGSAVQVAVFEKLGVQYQNADGSLRKLDDTFIDVAAALGGLTNNSERLALAQETLGRGALKLLPGFKATTEEMREQLKASGELAGLFSEDFIRSAEEYNDQMFFVRQQWSVFKSDIAMQFLPTLKAMADMTIRAARSFRAFLKETELLDRWFKASPLIAGAGLFAAIAQNWRTISRWVGVVLRLLKPFLPIIAKFLFWALVLDDIITFLQGGESALGRFLDEAMGVGTATKLLDGLKWTWDIVIDAIDLAWGVLKDLWDLFTDGQKEREQGADNLASSFRDIGDAIKGTIQFAKDLWGWLDKILGIKSMLGDIGQVIFEAGDHEANIKAMFAAQDRARAAAAKAAEAPRARGQAAPQIVDNSQTTVNLEGKQTPETVRAAADAAKNLRADSRRTRAAALRGAL